MKRIGKSKEPTVRQMLNMASNLKEKFKKYSTITSHSMSYSSGDSKHEFCLYVADKYRRCFDSWPKLQAYYFRLMK